MSAPPADKQYVRTTLWPNPTEPIPSGEPPAYVQQWPDNEQNRKQRRAGQWFLSVHEYDRSRHSRSAKSTIRRLGLEPTWQDVVKKADDLREVKEGRSSKPSRPPPDDPFAIGEAYAADLCRRLQRVEGRKPAAKRGSFTRWGPDARRKKKKQKHAEAQPEPAPVQPFVLSLNVDAGSDDESDSSDDDEEFVDITDDGCVDSDDDEVDEDGVELPRKPLPRYRARDLDAYSEKALTWLSRQIYRRREPELIKGVAIAVDGEVGCSEFEAFEASAKVHLIFTMLRHKRMHGGSLEECAKAALEVSPYGGELTKSPRTVLNWFADFKKNRGYFSPSQYAPV